MRRLLLPLALVLAALAVWWAVHTSAPSEVPVASSEAEDAAVEPVRLEGLPDDDTASPPPHAGEGLEGEELGDVELGASGTWLDGVDVRMLDAQNGTPIAGVEVIVDALYEKANVRTAISGPDGQALVPCWDGAAFWTVRCAGYVFQQHEVRAGREPRVLRLEAAPALIGRVVEDATDRPVAGARVLAMWADPPQSRADREQVTAADGRFEIAGVPPDRRVEFLVALDGFDTVRVRSDGTPALEVRLGAGAEVRGRVVDAAGESAPGADVFVVKGGRASPLRPTPFSPPLDELWPAHAIADAAGRFVLRGIAAPAEVIVYARGRDGAAGQSESLRLDGPDAQVEVEVSIAAYGEVVVSYRDASTGETLALRRCRCSIDADWSRASESQRASWDRARQTDVFPAVPSGTHAIHVLPVRHLAPPPTRVEVVAGESVRVEVALERGLTVTGRVVDDQGTPLEAYVMFAAEWRGVAQYPDARSGKDGRFALHAVPPVAGELSVFEDRSGERTWPDLEIAGDLGDLVVPRPPVLVGRLHVAWHDTPILCGTTSRSLFSEVGEIESEEGSIRIEGLVPGEATTLFLRPEGAGTALVLRDLVLAPGEVRDLGLLVFPEPVELTGRIVDAAGRPVSGAMVRTVERWYDERTRTDTEGGFRLPRFPPEPSTLWIETAPSTVAFVPVVAAPGMAPLEVRLEAPGRLRCRLLGPDGAPVPNAPVNVARLDDNGRADWRRRTIPRTDSLGRLDLALYPGGYVLIPHSSTELEAAGGNPTIEISSDEDVEVEIRTRSAR